MSLRPQNTIFISLEQKTNQERDDLSQEQKEVENTKHIKSISPLSVPYCVHIQEYLTGSSVLMSDYLSVKSGLIVVKSVLNHTKRFPFVCLSICVWWLIRVKNQNKIQVSRTETLVTLVGENRDGRSLTFIVEHRLSVSLSDSWTPCFTVRRKRNRLVRSRIPSNRIILQGQVFPVNNRIGTDGRLRNTLNMDGSQCLIS